MEKAEEMKQIPLTDAELLFLVNAMDGCWYTPNYEKRLDYLIYKLMLIRAGKAEVELLNSKEMEIES